jgi:hypothetical protein
MPDIPKSFMDSILNLLSSDDIPVATGFVMKYTDEFGDDDQYYAITCQHCIQQTATIRFSDGTTMSVARQDWSTPSNGNDIAVIDISNNIRGNTNIGYVDYGLAVTTERPFFGVGVDLYMLGLLVDNANISQNLVRARFGSLSAFADPQAPMTQGNGLDLPSHLGDMRSRTGFSGSPVFGYIALPAMDSHINYREVLFGVHSNQTSEEVKLSVGGDVYKIYIPSSLTIIVPAVEIIDLIKSDPRLSRLRAP